TSSKRDWSSDVCSSDLSHAGMTNRYVAGASGLPFAILRGYSGTDLVGHNPNISTVTCPFSGQEVAAVPAVNPDATVIHAQRADQIGRASCRERGESQAD